MASKSDWSKIEAAIVKTKSKSEALARLDESGHLETSSMRELVRTIAGATEPSGVIERLRVWNVEHRARMEALLAACAAAVTVLKGQIKAGEKVALTQTELRLQQTLEALKQQNLVNLSEQDAATYSEADQLMFKFTNSTAQQLREVSEADMPEPLKQRLMAFVMERYDDFEAKVKRAMSA